VGYHHAELDSASVKKGTTANGVNDERLTVNESPVRAKLYRAGCEACFF